METKELKTKDGKSMTTKDGKPLMQFKLEKGDLFIPSFNSVLERKNDAVVKGKKKVITNYSIKAKVKDSTGAAFKHDGEEEIFLSLTPTQAKALRKKAAEGLELNQNVFVCYEYEHEEYGTNLGVGLKGSNKPAIDWE